MDHHVFENLDWAAQAGSDIAGENGGLPTFPAIITAAEANIPTELEEQGLPGLSECSASYACTGVEEEENPDLDSFWHDQPETPVQTVSA